MALEFNAIARDSFDVDAYDRARKVVADLRHVETSFQSKTKHGRELVEDLHAALFRKKPVLKGDGDLSPTIQQHKALLTSIMQTSEYAGLHATTEFNHVRSALGVVELGKAIDEAKLPSDPDQRRRVVRTLLKNTVSKVDAYLDSLEMLGGQQPGEGSLTDLTDAVKAYAMVQKSAKAQEIMKLAGRMKRLAAAKRRARVRHGPDEIVDVELGNDLALVLPSELALLEHPALRLDFLRRFANGELLQYRIEGTEPLGRGPIVVCIDTSGSMEGAREFWSKAIALAMFSIAIEEKRDFSLILFSARRQVKRFDFGPKPDMNVVIKALEFFYNGGTDFESPLDEALKVCEQSKFSKADVIMITDGEAGISDEFERDFLARKKAKYVRLFTVLIGFTSASLRPLSDGIERIDDMEQDEAVADLVFGGL